MKAKINVDFEFLKGANFDHRHFHITDSNDVTLAYGNELVKNAKFVNGVSMDLYPNTLTVFSAQPNGAYKYEFPDMIIDDIEFDCSVPNTTKGTLMCDMEIEFSAQSKLMRGDIVAYINDTIPITYNGVDQIMLSVDPANGDILLNFEDPSIPY